MSDHIKITELFDESLAHLLSEKIRPVFPAFDAVSFERAVKERVVGKSYTQRILAIAEELHAVLPDDFSGAWRILSQILGPENLNETGMFTNWYWLMPIAKYIEVYGIDSPRVALEAISEITKRNTGEYAVRPYIRRYPEMTLSVIKQWAQSDNFHLRRLASEGLRPKLPWAPKLDTFVDEPQVVFSVLELLKEDEVTFVKKSVANHLTDWLKVNPEPTRLLLKDWKKSTNPHTQWVVKRATRKLS